MTNLNEIDFGIEPTLALNNALSAMRKSSKEALAHTPVPTRKTEAWKYSAKHLKLPEQFTSDTVTSSYQPGYQLDCYEIHIKADGSIEFDDALESAANISTQSFSALDEEQSKLIVEVDAKRDSELYFATLNTALLNNGVFIQVAKNAILEKPIKLVLSSPVSGVATPRVFINVLANAEATVVEELNLRGSSASQLLTNICDINVQQNARVKYLRMNSDSNDAKHVGLTSVDLYRDASFNSYCLGLGSAMARHDLRVKMLEPGAECELNGVCVTKDKQHFDNHTCIEHIAPNCTSNETYRCIADDQSHIVFNGRIHIHPDAQKTLGDMSNKNLLLSSAAEIDSKPELEIYADDVKCAHGTTIGQLDATELYYLQTRGVSESQARLMLTLGFVLEIVRAAPIEPIAEYWESKLAAMLSYQA